MKLNRVTMGSNLRVGTSMTTGTSGHRNTIQCFVNRDRTGVTGFKEGMPRIGSIQFKLKERQVDYPLQNTLPCQHLDFSLLLSRGIIHTSLLSLYITTVII